MADLLGYEPSAVRAQTLVVEVQLEAEAGGEQEEQVRGSHGAGGGAGDARQSGPSLDWACYLYRPRSTQQRYQVSSLDQIY